jgi:hypothetical protein
MEKSATIIYPTNRLPPEVAQFFTVHPKDPQPRLIRQAAQILREGGVIAYPTDSSYALGCQLGDLPRPPSGCGRSAAWTTGIT